MFDFDEVLVEIGEFGRFQIINYLLLCLPVFFSAEQSLSYIFTAGEPAYRCLIPECENDKTSYSQPWLEAAIPPQAEKAGKTVEYIPSQCDRYVPKGGADFECTKSDFTENITRCDAWVFDDNEWTIVGEWNITCPENRWKLSLVGTVHFIGILFGTILFGYLADRYGRKLVFVSCIILMSTTGVAQAVSTDYVMFQIFAFVNAMGTSGVYPLAFILGVELVGIKKREMSGVILNYFYAVGEASLGLIAWLSKRWTVIQLAISIPPIIFASYYWLIPESVRWLLANKKNKEASAIIQKAAQINKVKLSSQLIHSLENADANRDPLKPETKELSLWSTMTQLLRSRRLLFRSILMFYIWAANAFVFYGLSVNSTRLAGNKYLNYILVCLVEIPGYTLSWWTMDKLGRRWAMAGSLFLCSAAGMAAGFTPDDVQFAPIILSLLAKLGITSSFGVAYVYTAELYPTVLRSIGVGASSMMARLGAIIAPFAPLLATFNEALPLILFSVASLAAGFCSLLLPETLGVKLPDTMEDAEKLKLWKKDSRRNTDT